MARSIVISFTQKQADSLRAVSYMQTRSTSAIVRQAVEEYLKKVTPRLTENREPRS